MSKNIEVEDLQETVMEYLSDWKEDIDEDVKEVADKIGKEARKELKEKSPTGVRRQYRKGWRVRKDKTGKNKYVVKIHNKTDYQLTHLLEFGHATRDGGRTTAQPHIRPVEEKYSKEFEKDLKLKITQNSGG